jgi:hypothetical protein
LGALLFLSTGCATLFENTAAEMAGAIAVQNPVRTGKVDTGTVSSQAGTAQMLSYDKATKTLCFAIESELALAPGAGVETELRTYAEPSKDLNTAKAIKPSSLLKKSTRNQVYTYHDTQKTTYKDSTGATYATAETPVTKTGVQELATYNVCFKDLALADNAKYLVLLHRFPTMFGPRNYREIWQLDEAAH